ncbi:hypothetical protein Ciccas_011423 [Cichlidogyrus casuarinus]|uniref:Uncharacterized protein n=1 Tax=Cichlidogyrus casuarinus TaxID=1844966 RepID=A0ABD2PRA6_9PLAT
MRPFMKYLLGIGLFVLTDIIWVLDSELSNYIYLNERFDNPYFGSYFKNCMYCVMLIGFVMPSWRAFLFSPLGNLDASTNNVDDVVDIHFDSQNVAVKEAEDLESGSSQHIYIPPLLTKTEFFRLALENCMVLSVGAYLYQAALSMTTPSLVSALSSVQTIILLILCAIYPAGIADRINLTKVLACCIVFVPGFAIEIVTSVTPSILTKIAIRH